MVERHTQAHAPCLVFVSIKHKDHKDRKKNNKKHKNKAVGSSVFVNPTKMKVADLREQIAERNIHVEDKARKSALVRAMTKWVQEQRKKIAYSASDLNKLPMDKEIKKLLAIVAAATDLLMVCDSHSHPPHIK